MDYDTWLFTSERDEEEELELELRRKLYEERRQEQEEDMKYWNLEGYQMYIIYRCNLSNNK